jgi:predicted regulator of Ras-like GTPase activity (Roadblock/LC7/MglB family)
VSDAYAAALDRVSHVPGVRGALIVDADAGVPVLAEVEAGASGAAIAALAAALYRRSARVPGAGSFGPLGGMHLEADGGHLIVAGAGELLVVVLAQSDAQLGLIRVETLRAAGALQ